MLSIVYTSVEVLFFVTFMSAVAATKLDHTRVKTFKVVIMLYILIVKLISCLGSHQSACYNVKISFFLFLLHQLNQNSNLTA